MGVALYLSLGQAFPGKIVDFWEESLHRQACVLSVRVLCSIDEDTG